MQHTGRLSSHTRLGVFLSPQQELVRGSSRAAAIRCAADCLCSCGGPLLKRLSSARVWVGVSAGCLAVPRASTRPAEPLHAPLQTQTRRTQLASANTATTPTQQQTQHQHNNKRCTNTTATQQLNRHNKRNSNTTPTQEQTQYQHNRSPRRSRARVSAVGVPLSLGAHCIWCLAVPCLLYACTCWLFDWRV